MHASTNRFSPASDFTAFRFGYVRPSFLVFLSVLLQTGCRASCSRAERGAANAVRDGTKIHRCHVSRERKQKEEGGAGACACIRESSSSKTRRIPASIVGGKSSSSRSSGFVSSVQLRVARNTCPSRTCGFRPPRGRRGSSSIL